MYGLLILRHDRRRRADFHALRSREGQANTVLVA